MGRVVDGLDDGLENLASQLSWPALWIIEAGERLLLPAVNDD